MKQYPIIIAAILLLASCDKSKMEWATSEGEQAVTNADIPLTVDEQIANYKPIKDYAVQYTPNLKVGVGFDAGMYIKGGIYKQLVDENFQIVTAGNEMKMSYIVQPNGDLSFKQLDNMFESMDGTGLALWGHNFIWHHQQQQTYLLSLVAPILSANNMLTSDSHDFEGGTLGNWSSWGNNSVVDVSADGEGHNSKYSAKLTNPTASQSHQAQFAYTFNTPLEKGKVYMIRFWAKSEAATSKLEFCHQNSKTYGSQIWYSFNITNEWQQYSYFFTQQYDDVDRILINFGENATTWYLDDIEFGLKEKLDAAAPRRAGGNYVIKTPEEKRALLLGAMDKWIKGMGDYLKGKGITPYGYDVINEAIDDGSNLRRGIDKVFDGTDTEPVENVTDGLTIDWADQNFYWGYWVPDYAVQAYQKARQYLPAETKLFYNDYGLETSPSKRKAIIQFVKDIDAANGSPIVDGIGTQMHLTLDVSDDDDLNTQINKFMALVDASLTDLAASGKIIRITELDIALGTATPSEKQLQAQYEAFRRVFESYKKIIPAAQQSGITIWGLSDNDDEHAYWLLGESPDLWNKDYKRKRAYKGVCDGIAGKDLGTQFKGDDYKRLYNE